MKKETSATYTSRSLDDIHQFKRFIHPAVRKFLKLVDGELSNYVLNHADGKQVVAFYLRLAVILHKRGVDGDGAIEGCKGKQHEE